LKRVLPFAFWQSVTGSLDHGESPIEAARRELFEETALADEGELIDTGKARTFTIDPRWLDRYPDGITENREYEWRYRVDAITKISMDSNEHSDCRWLPIEEAIEKVWSWTNREALQGLRRELR
jgi:dATP pyrophosphohydrolase